MSGYRVVAPKVLTAEAFSPYGDVIEVRESADHRLINRGYTQRFDDLTDLDLGAQGGRAQVAIFRSEPLKTPIVLEVMERHPLSSQAFYPLSNRPYLVAVAPKGRFDASQMELFLASPSQGVNYHRGTWHHFCLALQQSSDFLVIDRGGEGENCDEVELEEAEKIEVLLP